MEKIFLDECGYTGEDLFNDQQPIFTIASLHLPEGTCKELKEKHFALIKAKELKHTNLVKRPVQQKMVFNLIKDLACNSKVVKFSVSHKRYVLVSKMVDTFIETLAHEGGIDLYERGANIAFTNMLYYMTKSLAGEKFFQEMIFKFQEMMRNRTIKTYNNFFKLFFKNRFPEVLEDLFVFFKACHIRYGTSLIAKVPRDSLDIAFSNAFALVAIWSEDIPGSITLIHDKSSNMAKRKDIWNRILHPDIPPALVGYDRRTMRFPIRVKRTVFENSENWAGLQLVDILAGAMSRWMTWIFRGKDAADKYAKDLTEVIPEFGGNTILPAPEFTPEQLGTTGSKVMDPIQHIIKIAKDLL